MYIRFFPNIDMLRVTCNTRRIVGSLTDRYIAYYLREAEIDFIISKTDFCTKDLHDECLNIVKINRCMYTRTLKIVTELTHGTVRFHYDYQCFLLLKSYDISTFMIVVTKPFTQSFRILKR